jgi:hypothetical protein
LAVALVWFVNALGDTDFVTACCGSKGILKVLVGIGPGRAIICTSGIVVDVD